MSFITFQTKSTLKDAFKYQATQRQIAADKLQILISIKKENNLPTVEYAIVNEFDYANKNVVTFRQLTGLNNDMMGKEGMSKQYFPKHVERISRDKKINTETTEIMVVNDGSKLGFLLYDNKQPLKAITLDYFLGESDDEL